MNKKEVKETLGKIKENLERLDEFFKAYMADAYRHTDKKMSHATEVLGEHGIEVLIGLCEAAKPKLYREENSGAELKQYHTELAIYVGDIEAAHPPEAAGSVYVNGGGARKIYPDAVRVMAGTLRHIVQTGGKILGKSEGL